MVLMFSNRCSKRIFSRNHIMFAEIEVMMFSELGISDLLQPHDSLHDHLSVVCMISQHLHVKFYFFGNSITALYITVLYRCKYFHVILFTKFLLHLNFDRNLTSSLVYTIHANLFVTCTTHEF